MRIWQHKKDNDAPASDGVLTAAEDNARGFELNDAIAQCGIALDPTFIPPDTDTNLNMLAESMNRCASGGVFGIDVGAVNSVQLNGSGGFIVPKALFRGMQAVFFAGNTNTGTTTLNAFGIGQQHFLDQFGNEMQGGELQAGLLSAAIYDTTATVNGVPNVGAWKIMPWANMRSGGVIDIDTQPPSKAWTYRINNSGLVAVDVDAAVGDFNTDLAPVGADWLVGFRADGTIVKYPVSAFLIPGSPNFCVGGGTATFVPTQLPLASGPFGPTYNQPYYTWLQVPDTGVYEVTWSDMVVNINFTTIPFVSIQWSWDNGNTWYYTFNFVGQPSSPTTNDPSQLIASVGEGSDVPVTFGLNIVSFNQVAMFNGGTAVSTVQSSGKFRFSVSKVINPNPPGGGFPQTAYVLWNGDTLGPGAFGAGGVYGAQLPRIRLAVLGLGAYTGGQGSLSSWGIVAPTLCRLC